MLHALEMKLGIDDAGERFWLVPVAVLLSTILAFFTIGQITAAPLYVSLPNGVVIAFVMAGLTVACMRPGADDSPPEDPPEHDDDAPVLGSPGGPWTVIEHLGRAAPAADPVPAGFAPSPGAGPTTRSPTPVSVPPSPG